MVTGFPGLGIRSLKWEQEMLVEEREDLWWGVGLG